MASLRRGSPDLRQQLAGLHHFASYATVQQIVESFFAGKGERVAAKYFRENAAKAYKFVKR